MTAAGRFEKGGPMSDAASQAERDAIAWAVAERTLLRHGARIIAQGWSCPEGSIGFIAEKDGELVLADARMAESTAREDMERPVPGETVDRWERVACALASQAACELPDMRFDMITAAECSDGSYLSCHHIRACELTAAERKKAIAGRQSADSRPGEEKEDCREIEGDSHSEPKRRRGKDDHCREPGRGAR